LEDIDDPSFVDRLRKLTGDNDFTETEELPEAFDMEKQVVVKEEKVPVPEKEAPHTRKRQRSPSTRTASRSPKRRASTPETTEIMGQEPYRMPDSQASFPAAYEVQPERPTEKPVGEVRKFKQKCKDYFQHGWCERGDACPYDHDRRAIGMGFNEFEQQFPQVVRITIYFFLYSHSSKTSQALALTLSNSMAERALALTMVILGEVGIHKVVVTPAETEGGTVVATEGEEIVTTETVIRVVITVIGITVEIEIEVTGVTEEIGREVVTGTGETETEEIEIEAKGTGKETEIAKEIEEIGATETAATEAIFRIRSPTNPSWYAFL
jgi:hypothetical protein